MRIQTALLVLRSIFTRGSSVHRASLMFARAGKNKNCTHYQVRSSQLRFLYFLFFLPNLYLSFRAVNCACRSIVFIFRSESAKREKEREYDAAA